MAIIYNWVISAMTTAPAEDGLTDVVKTVHWRKTATEMVSDRSYTAEVYGAMACATPSATDFTAYPDLTQAQIEGWLIAGLDVEALEAGLATQIQNQITPQIVNLPLPWEPATPTPQPTE